MNSDKNRQPAGIPVGGQFAGHIHAEGVNLADEEEAGSKVPIFTPDELQRLWEPKSGDVREKAEEIALLSHKPVSNFFAVRREKEELARRRIVLDYYQNRVQAIAKANDQWHEKNPGVPSWAHSTDKVTESLYSDLRRLDIVAERAAVSPGYETAKKELHHLQLDDDDREVLSDYFHFHKRHGGDDHSHDDDPYWPTQERLDCIASKLPPMDEAVTVWRGEIFTTEDFATTETHQNNVERINGVMALKPGDEFEWTNCVATSLHVTTAAGYDFCYPRDPEDFQVSVTWDGSKPVEHAVLFELETDRGIFIDRDLASAGTRNEDEILLPRNMKFTVLGHWQIASSKVGGGGDKAIHVIKLKLADPEP